MERHIIIIMLVYFQNLLLMQTAKKAKTLDGLCEAEGYLDVYQALQYCK